MSANSSSIDTQISVDLYTVSLDSRILIEDCNSLTNKPKIDEEILEWDEMLIETGIFQIPNPMR